MSAPDYTNLSKSFFAEHAHKYDMAEASECGKYTEAFVKFARGVDPKIGHLKKHGGTQYNGHAIDAVLYPVGNGVYHSIDIIGSAEQPHPWISEGGHNPDPSGQWNEYEGHDYTAADWIAEPAGPPVHTVPYKAYEGDSYWHDQVGKTLYWDYTGKTHDNKPTSNTRAGRPGLDSMSTVWTARVIHDIKMEGLTPEASLTKHRAEWCSELQIPVIPVPPEVLQ